MTVLDTAPKADSPAPETGEAGGQNDKVGQVLAEASDMTFRPEQRYGLSEGSLDKLGRLMTELEMNEEEKGQVYDSLAEQRDQMAYYKTLMNAAEKAGDAAARERLMQDARDAIGIGLEEPEEGPVWEETPKEQPPAAEKKPGRIRRWFDRLMGRG